MQYQNKPTTSQTTSRRNNKLEPLGLTLRTTIKNDGGNLILEANDGLWNNHMAESLAPVLEVLAPGDEYIIEETDHIKVSVARFNEAKAPVAIKFDIAKVIKKETK